MIRELLRKLESHPVYPRLLDQVREGRRTVTLSGLSGSSKSLLVALLQAELKKPFFFVAPSNREATEAAQDFRFFISQLQDDDGRALFCPALDVDPYRGLPLHPILAQQRATALWLMTQEVPAFVAVPIRSLMWRLPDQAELASEGVIVRRGDWLDQDRLMQKLAESGYMEEDPVAEEGEYSRRGGIVDIYPPISHSPIRLEFLGDEIVSIRTYDTSTQRSIKEIESVTIPPLRELILNPQRLALWADAAEERWRDVTYYSRLESQLTQARRGESFAETQFYMPLLHPLSSSFLDYIPDGVWVLDEPENLRAEAESFEKQLRRRYAEVGGEEAPVLPPEDFIRSSSQLFPCLNQCTTLQLQALDGVDSPAGRDDLRLATQPVRKYQGLIRQLIGDLGRSYREGEQLLLLSSSVGRAERVQELLAEAELPGRLIVPSEPVEDRPVDSQPGVPSGPAANAPITLGVADLSSGFRVPELRWTLMGSKEVFGDNEIAFKHGRSRHRVAQGAAFFSDFRDLKVGDYVVHVDHGIGQFRGLFRLSVGDRDCDFVLLHYKNEAKLYVPVERLDLIEKYSSIGGGVPTLDLLGGQSWEKTKARIKKSMRDMAEELLRLYAQRNLIEGFAFSPDGPWQKEFEEAFEFQETPDQLSTLTEVKSDMESSRPMDRLICGDVGYGKTEVAIRAAFKSVMDGKQVCILAPTTILAFQHFNTFSERLKAFPIRLEMLSRFRTAREQKQVVADTELGKVDILIGTHRLLSRDVGFKDLGLVIVDEEQRFGVTHKEKLKRLKTRVDVLTMTATPIPRTLHMSMMGIRDLSVIETPPKDRLAIQTSVVKYSSEVIKAAIEMELARRGQVYFVHNRVESIYSMASLVQRLCPNARVAVGHGQMSERELEDVMLKFVRHETDVLVATTIIENGLDIPRVNTMIINRSDRYGLSQLYQLRGRVGRSNRRAYAYLLIPSEETLSTVARRRLAAIREFSDLGSGFRLAALDLELRGAGNLLGAEQHGRINTVGFDLYCRLLERTVQELKGEELPQESQASINLGMEIRIPEDYVAETNQRLRLYKRISSSKTEDELDSLRAELIDRYGPLPAPLNHLFAYAELRLLAIRIGIESIDRQDGKTHIKFSSGDHLDPRKLLQLIQSSSELSLSPAGLLTVDSGAGSAADPITQVMSLLQKVL